MEYDAGRRGILLTIAAAPFLALPMACRAARMQGEIEIWKLRRRGDAGDGPSLARALAKGRLIRLAGGRGSAPDGAYIMDMVDLPADVTIYGDGPATVVRSSGPGIANVFVAESEHGEATRGITLRDMTIEGYVEGFGFVEHHNLVNVSGVTDFVVSNVFFRGFAGDAIYIGAERDGAERSPRDNSRISIRNCRFDGINGDNRNAISVLGGTDVAIEDCHFVRCTRHDMPGPIDFEADGYPFYVFRQLAVRNCTFETCGGNVGQISVVVPAVVREVPRGVTVTGNRFSNYRGSGSDVAVTVNRPATAAMPQMKVLIADNVGTNGRAGVRIYSARGVILRNNSWRRYEGQSIIGYAHAADGCMDVRISDSFDQCGLSDGAALGIYKAESVEIRGCTFTNCGNGKRGSTCILFGTGLSDGVTLSQNDFRNNPGVRAPIRRDTGHVLKRPLVMSQGNLLPPGRRPEI